MGNREYLQTTTSHSKNKMAYSGDEQFVQYMKNENSDTTGSKTKIVSLIRTENEQEGIIPLSIEYLETNKQNSNGILQDGDTFYGSFSDSNSLQLDSTSAKKLFGEREQQFFEVLEKGFETLIFDGGEMKVGDSTTTKTALLLPIGNKQVELIFVTTYKLREINKNLAEFDVRQTGTLDLNDSGIQLAAIASGEGTCTYSIKDHYLTKNSANLVLNMKMDLGSNRKIHLIMTSLSEVENEITEIK